jgi:hypothetical protein
VRRNLPKKGKTKAAFMMMLFLATFMISLLPKVAVAQVAISIKPQVGYMGDTLHVNGTIATTNGNYTIFFDGKLMKSGTAMETKVNDAFIVPPRPKGNYTIVLQDVKANKNVTATFTLEMKCYIKAVAPPSPKQLQEGMPTEIWVNVTGGEANTVYSANITVKEPPPAILTHWTTVSLTNTTTTGSGNGNAMYPLSFSAGAHTNYTGIYNIAFNQTLASGNFTVGLTNATEYHTFQVVNIRAAGYRANEPVFVNVTRWVNATYRESVLSENRSAVGGVVETNWEIPWNALMGLYSVTVTNSTTPGTVKPVLDNQNFTVTEKIIPIYIYPTIGSWGNPVRVEGEVVKPGGSYQIKWDNEIIKPGNCGSGSVIVNDTFSVPPSVKGYHNITLYDVNQTTESMPVEFEVTTSCYVLPQPARILEGWYTTITVGVRNAEANKTYTFAITVTDPLNQTWNANSLVTTNNNGSGENSVNYPETSTDYLGTYSMTVNKTLATGSFTVGLTDEPEYRRTKRVNIQGSGYGKQEIVTINITRWVNATYGESVFSENRSAVNGTVGSFWDIPENATLGIYTVTLKHANGTFKPVHDIQNFTIVKIIVHCQAQNKYDNKSLAGVTIEVYVNVTLVVSGITNKTGWVDFLDSVGRGNCTFMALWENETVGSLTGNVTGNLTGYVLQKTLYIGCELAHIEIAVVDESHPPQPLPFINITLRSNKTGTLLFTTNYTGTIALNTFTNISYTIEARRYGYLFNTTLIENLTFTLDINITCPTYTIFAQVLDSKELSLQNVQVKVYEWGSERLMGSKVTNNLGSATFDCTFGRYTVRVYDLESGVILNETIIDLIENPFFFVIHCRISNVDLSVVVKDYFGHSIPNAKVKVERDGVEIATLTTGSNGTVSLHKIIGGSCKISVYIGGELCETTTLYLDETKVVVFKLERFIVFGGYPLETTQLVAGISLGVLIALFASALIYRRLRTRKVLKEKSL